MVEWRILIVQCTCRYINSTSVVYLVFPSTGIVTLHLSHGQSGSLMVGFLLFASLSLRWAPLRVEIPSVLVQESLGKVHTCPSVRPSGHCSNLGAKQESILLHQTSTWVANFETFPILLKKDQWHVIELLNGHENYLSEYATKYATQIAKLKRKYAREGGRSALKDETSAKSISTVASRLIPHSRICLMRVLGISRTRAW